VSRILIAGIGNIFMGDDAFGCEVASRLGRCKLPGHVDVVDFGIRAMDLSYALTEGYDFVILIDAVKRASASGTVYVIEPDLSDSGCEGELDQHPMAMHEMDLSSVLRFVASLGKGGPRVLLVGCEPECLGGDSGHIGLSAAVSAAVDRAVVEIQTLLKEFARGRIARWTERQTVVGTQSRVVTQLQEVSR
jgi:hydrogenase maturation protease